MSISLPLITKVIAGVTTISAPIALSVVYRENIYGLFNSEKSNPDGDVVPETLTEDDINNAWKINKDDSSIQITYKNGKTCSINLTGDSKSTKIAKIAKELKDKLGETTASKEDHRRYKRGLFNKCKSSKNKTISLSSENINFSDLFNLKEENLTTEESKDLENKEFTFASEVNSGNLTVSVTVNYNNDDSSVKICKIIGSKKPSSEEIDITKLNNSKTEIETSVKSEFEGSNKENNRKNFLTKCKRSYNNEISLTLNKKTDGTENYEFEGLSSIFQQPNKNSHE